jgi:hypothetical protein
VKAGTIAILLLLVSAVTFADNGEQKSFDIVVPHAPDSVKSEGLMALFYECHLTNFSTHSLVLRAMRVLDADGQKPLTEFSADLADHLSLAGTPDFKGLKKEVLVVPGARAILFVELTLDDHAIPVALRHDVDYSIAGESTVHTLHAGNVLVDPTVAVALGPPLREGIWVALHSPAWPRGTDGSSTRSPARPAFPVAMLSTSSASTSLVAPLMAIAISHRMLSAMVHGCWLVPTRTLRQLETA